MNDSTLETTWNAVPHGRITIDLDVLLNEVRHNEQHFRATIFWRDTREVVVALALVPLFWYMGVWLQKPWTWYLVIPALLWIAGFLLVDRFRRRTQRPTPGMEFRIFVEKSLADVRHQIWLLHNVFWWHLLPILAAITISIAHRAIDRPLAGTLVTLSIVYGVFWLFWKANQYAVHKTLQPRARQLETLLDNLTNGG